MKIKILLLAVMLIFVGCSKKSSQDDTSLSQPLRSGDVVVLKGVEGGEKRLKKTEDGFVLVGEEDKVLILDIFGTFCPPCQEEAPSLTNFQIEYSDKVVLIGLTHLEEVTDSYVVENFSTPYNAHYFISNSKENKRIVESVLKDIKYPNAIQIPFKVVLKKGKYQVLTDVWEMKDGVKYYLGNVGARTIKDDIDNILK